MTSRVWRDPGLDRRTLPRAEYRRTAPGLLQIDQHLTAVRDLGAGGLRIEPAPAGRVWQPGERVAGELRLRSGELIRVEGYIARIDRAGLAIVPGDGPWPSDETIESERVLLARGRPERRGSPRLPLPELPAGAGPSPLRDVSATGLRYALRVGGAAAVPGSRVEGELRLDADTVIPVRGRVVRQGVREVAVALDEPGLTPEILALLRSRFFPESR